MTTAHVSTPIAASQAPWGAMTMVVAVLLSVALLVAAGLDRPADTAPMRFPDAPAEGVLAVTEQAAEPAPAPAPQPGLLR